MIPWIGRISNLGPAVSLHPTDKDSHFPVKVRLKLIFILLIKLVDKITSLFVKPTLPNFGHIYIKMRERILLIIEAVRKFLYNIHVYYKLQY